MKLQSLAVSLGPRGLTGDSQRSGLPLVDWAIGVEVGFLKSDLDSSSHGEAEQKACDDPDDSRQDSQISEEESEDDYSFDGSREAAGDASDAGEWSAAVLDSKEAEKDRDIRDLHPPKIGDAE